MKRENDSKPVPEQMELQRQVELDFDGNRALAGLSFIHKATEPVLLMLALKLDRSL